MPFLQEELFTVKDWRDCLVVVVLGDPAAASTCWDTVMGFSFSPPWVGNSRYWLGPGNWCHKAINSRRTHNFRCLGIDFRYGFRQVFNVKVGLEMGEPSHVDSWIGNIRSIFQWSQSRCAYISMISAVNNSIRCALLVMLWDFKDVQRQSISAAFCLLTLLSCQQGSHRVHSIGDLRIP